MKGNVWLAGFIVFSLLVIGGAGFFTFKEYGGYRERFEGWNSRVSKIARLEKEIPTPTKKNEEDFRAALEDYEEKVTGLFDALNQFQRPLDPTLNQTDFPNILKKKVDEFRKLAGQGGTNISKLDRDNSFFMGMKRYQNVLPKQEITPLLSYQLDAIERSLQHIVESDMGAITELARDPLPGEEEEVEDSPGELDVVQKYPVQFRFEGTHRAFRTLLNRLANDKEFFFIVRVLAVENSAPDGPSLAQNAVTYIDKNGNPVPKDEAEAALAGLIGEDLQIKLEDLEWTAVEQDAAILFGEETLEVFMVLDIVRFLPPDEGEETTTDGNGDENGSS